jgi:hypothetical protein
MIKLEITAEQLKRARGLYDFGVLKGSITEGRSNLYGALGEVITFDYLASTGRNVIMKSTADYDMTINGNKVDIKTKKTTVTPLPNFNCSIAAYNTTQKCDHYLFVRVHENLHDAWLLGYIHKNEFFNRAKFFRKNQKDPNKPTWKFRADCYNIEISKLQSIKVE